MSSISEKINAKRSIKESTMNMYLHEIKLLSKQLTGAEYVSPEFICSCDEAKATEGLLDALNLYASECSNCGAEEFCETCSDRFYEQMDTAYIHTTALQAKVESVCEAIGKQSANLSSRKKKLNSLLVLLNAEGIGNPRKGSYKPHPWVDGSHQELYDLFTAKRDELSQAYEKWLATHKKSQKQKDNWVSWDIIEDVMNTKRKNVRNLKIHKKQSDQLTYSELKALQDYLCASLYFYNPPRRNIYAGMKVVQSVADMTDGHNYLLNESRSRKLFYLNHQKSKAFDKQQIIPVHSKLNKALNAWLKHNVSGYLLVNLRKNQRFEPMTPTGLTHYLNRMYEKATGKKKIGCTILRQIHNTEKLGAVALELETNANLMGHSASTAIKHYVKVD